MDHTKSTDREQAKANGQKDDAANKRGKVRGEQLSLLRLLRLPDVLKTKHGQSVSPGIVKAVLRAIDDYDGVKGCWASVETLSDDTCFSESVVGRAIEVLKSLDLIISTPRYRDTNIHSINWGVVSSSRFAPRAKSLPVNEKSHSAPGVSGFAPGVSGSAPGVKSSCPTGKGNAIETQLKRKRNAKHEIDESLLSLIRWWNSLKERKLVLAGVETEPSKGVLAGWKRFKKSPELRTLLADRTKIETALQQSYLPQKGAWFTLPKLLGGTVPDGEYAVRKLLDGSYADIAGSKPKTANDGPGVNYDPNRSISDDKF
ncbi:MAG: hypothetical protein SGI77_23530 [Pirellulaceae bacterium]|nr:hypothetical protein [Pirellulaceae bacterium]